MLYVYDTNTKKAAAIFNAEDPAAAYQTAVHGLLPGKWYYCQVEHGPTDEDELHFEWAYENDVPGALPPQGPFNSRGDAFNAANSLFIVL